jgi:hypothetical protein
VRLHDAVERVVEGVWIEPTAIDSKTLEEGGEFCSSSNLAPPRKLLPRGPCHPAKGRGAHGGGGRIAATARHGPRDQEQRVAEQR